MDAATRLLPRATPRRLIFVVPVGTRTRFRPDTRFPPRSARAVPPAIPPLRRVPGQRVPHPWLFPRLTFPRILLTVERSWRLAGNVPKARSSPDVKRPHRPPLPAMRGKDPLEFRALCRLPRVLLGAVRHPVALRHGIAHGVEPHPLGDRPTAPEPPVAAAARMALLARRRRAAAPGSAAPCDLARGRPALVLGSLLAGCHGPRRGSRSLRDLGRAGAGAGSGGLVDRRPDAGIADAGRPIASGGFRHPP